MAFTLPDIEGLKAHVVKECAERIRRRTPVDTGRARAGWEVTGDSIRNDVPYVGYLEYGTGRMRPFAMVRTTLEEIPDIIKQYLDETRR